MTQNELPRCQDGFVQGIGCPICSPVPLDVERLARAIHGSNDHSDRPGCLDMDRDTARLLAAEYDRLRSAR